MTSCQSVASSNKCGASAISTVCVKYQQMMVDAIASTHSIKMASWVVLGFTRFVIRSWPQEAWQKHERGTSGFYLLRSCSADDTCR